MLIQYILDNLFCHFLSKSFVSCFCCFVQVHFLWFHIKDVIKSFETFERWNIWHYSLTSLQLILGFFFTFINPKKWNISSATKKRAKYEIYMHIMTHMLLDDWSSALLFVSSDLVWSMQSLPTSSCGATVWCQRQSTSWITIREDSLPWATETSP